MQVWIWAAVLAVAGAVDAPEHDLADEQSLLIVELVDSDAASGAELRCPGGHRDAAQFVYGRAVLRAPGDDCTLHFVGGDALFGPTGPGELLCELSGDRASCFSVCDPEAP